MINKEDPRLWLKWFKLAPPGISKFAPTTILVSPFNAEKERIGTVEQTQYYRDVNGRIGFCTKDHFKANLSAVTKEELQSILPPMNREIMLKKFPAIQEKLNKIADYQEEKKKELTLQKPSDGKKKGSKNKGSSNNQQR